MYTVWKQSLLKCWYKYIQSRLAHLCCIHCIQGVYKVYTRCIQGVYKVYTTLYTPWLKFYTTTSTDRKCHWAQGREVRHTSFQITLMKFVFKRGFWVPQIQSSLHLYGGSCESSCICTRVQAAGQERTVCAGMWRRYLYKCMGGGYLNVPGAWTPPVAKTMEFDNARISLFIFSVISLVVEYWHHNFFLPLVKLERERKKRHSL